MLGLSSSRFGPVLPVASASLSVWQVAQLGMANSEKTLRPKSMSSLSPGSAALSHAESSSPINVATTSVLLAGEVRLWEA
jgi:hypothetical protein